MRVRAPTLLLDEHRCKSNIRRMIERSKRAGVAIRPHFKTHQSRRIGKWFSEMGVNLITVSSVDMAGYFAEEGWSNITIAFPANPADTARIDRLAGNVDLTLLVESAPSVKAIDGELTHGVRVMIKVDTGYGRTGVKYDNASTLREVADAIARSTHLQLTGYLAHAGHSYSARSTDEIAQISEETTGRMATVADTLADHVMGEVIISIGDTPCCSVATEFGCAGEIRPGNFVFYDMQQVMLGSCSMDDIAIALACPVVALHPERDALIVHGGAVHLSKDSYVDADDRRVFGQVVRFADDGRAQPVEGARLTSLSQEHGMVTAPGEFIQSLSAGDTIGVLPAHSCLTANSMGEYVTLEGHRLDHMSGAKAPPP